MARINVFLSFIVVASLVAFVQSQATRQNAARIPMESLRTLYFKDGHKTLSRRNKKFPQLQCTGNSQHICDTYGPDVALCRHLGDGAWKCEADLHHSVRFGNVDVSCEGWEGPHDEYILRGSCMLKYTLLPNYPDQGRPGLPSRWASSVHWEPILFYGAMIAIFLYFWFKGRAEQEAVNRANGRRPGGGGDGGHGGGGGGGGGGQNDAPPPYVPYPKQEPGTSPPPSSSSSSWRPGFWTGLAGGALASETARYMRGGDQQQQRQRPGFFGGGGGRSTYFDDDDGFGGGGGGGGNVFGAAGPSRSSRSDSGGDSRRAYGYGGSSVR